MGVLFLVGSNWSLVLIFFCKLLKYLIQLHPYVDSIFTAVHQFESTAMIQLTRKSEIYISLLNSNLTDHLQQKKINLITICNKKTALQFAS